MRVLVYCINTDFDDAAKSFYEKHGITLPVKDKEYQIRSVMRVKDQYFIRLVEIINPAIEINGVGIVEPGFHYSRFTDVPENVLEWETVHKIFLKQL